MTGLTGYLREDGRKGVRNHVVILAAADNANPLARQLAAAVPGTVLLPASYGRGQLGADFELALRAMAGLAAHPNNAACLVVSFDPESSRRIAERAAALGRTVSCLSFLEEGGLEACLTKGQAILTQMMAEAGAMKRASIAASDLLIGLECGGSDTSSGLFGNPALGRLTDRHLAAGGSAIFSEPVECLGGEDLLIGRARSPQVAKDLIATVKAYDNLARSQGIDLAGINPTPDNMAGGLTTIEEKSLGALAKTGSGIIEGVLAYGERPAGPGLWMMDAPAAAVENITALAAGGCQIICFVTGSCNPSGHPIAPTIKITANTQTVSRMPMHIDVALEGMARGVMSLDEGANAIADAIASVADGNLTASERLDYLETNISRIGASV